MVSPLGPTLANVFLCYHEKIWLQIVLLNLNVLSIKVSWWYIPTFSLETSHPKIQNYLNCQHENIRFPSEIEHENSISLLDIKISRDNNKFKTSVLCKPTFSGDFTNFGSFIPKSYKYDLLFTDLHRAFKLCSNFELFHQEINKLKTIFENNGYPKSFVDLYTKKYLDKVFIKKKVVLKPSKMELICVLPFIGKSNCSWELV